MRQSTIVLLRDRTPFRDFLRSNSSAHSHSWSHSVPTGERAEYVYRVPDDHMGGTFWYHPHHHGAGLAQVRALHYYITGTSTFNSTHNIYPVLPDDDPLLYSLWRTAQVGGGALGMIIVDDKPDHLPAVVAKLPELSLLIMHVSPRLLNRVVRNAERRCIQDSGTKAACSRQVPQSQTRATR